MLARFLMLALDAVLTLIVWGATSFRHCHPQLLILVLGPPNRCAVKRLGAHLFCSSPPWTLALRASVSPLVLAWIEVQLPLAPIKQAGQGDCSRRTRSDPRGPAGGLTSGEQPSRRRLVRHRRRGKAAKLGSEYAEVGDGKRRFGALQNMPLRNARSRRVKQASQRRC